MFRYDSYFDEIRSRLNDADPDQLKTLCSMLLQTKQAGRKVIVAGNGGSAAIASHVAIDLTKVTNIRTVNFNEASLITCFANDYGYEHWLARAVDAYADDGDVVLLVSSSGRSPNVVNAAAAARARNCAVVTLTGFDPGNPLRALGDLNLWIDSSAYNVVETVHQTWLLAVLDNIAADGVVQ